MRQQYHRTARARGDDTDERSIYFIYIVAPSCCNKKGRHELYVVSVSITLASLAKVSSYIVMSM